MKQEVLSAVNFLVDLVRINGAQLSESQLANFRNHAFDCLLIHYRDHWFPEAPMKGSGYRCIRINGKMDPLIARAGELVGLAAGALRSLFPSELTMWVDPCEVAYRIGENGSICNLFEPEGPPPSPKPAAQTPAKAAPKTKVAPSPPPHQLTQQQQQQLLQQHQLHFSPVKSSPSPPSMFHSPPRSPLFNSSQRQQQQQLQQQQLMLLLNSSNCKDQLRPSGVDLSSRGLERLFVSS